MSISRSLVRPLLLGASAIVLIACGSQAPKPGDTGNAPEPGQTDFISHVLGSNNGNDVALDGGAESAASGGQSAGPAADPNNAGDAGEAERAISEADILKVDGDRLYALSRYSGLSVIDISRPASPKLLGTHRTTATPFEMYVEGDRAYVMYNGWGHYEVNADGYFSWETTSRIQALDLSNPAAIGLLGEKDMPGELSDSRKVGDVLYLVTYENGYCWGCEDVSNTRVTSFNVADPDDFQFIDELRLADANGYWGKRSISVTTERIYISGWDWGGSSAGVIDVVDITDPSGDLVAGAEVPIAGPVESRWQIDEFEGVLRVISQPGGWNTTSPPIVETFRVESSSQLDKLAELQMVLPRPEDLRSVRFDGERAYAITFERTDPLFTLDLRDPSAPEQVGELEIPGWVYHMEPRGDRIYALGFDDASESGGALHVSLFDVSTLSEPKQLARVNFGGAWANFAEDQDRIHKAFNIMPEEGLILVPFSGWDYEDASGEEFECWGGEYLSGIQLVDMTEDSLTLRGVAPQVGQARRGFLANGALFGLSDNAVQTFDISDRDAPQALGELELARNINSIKVVGDSLLRFGHDWWTEQTTLDFAATDKVDVAEPLGDIDLSDYAIEDSDCYGYSYWESGVLVSGDYAYVPRRSYEWQRRNPDGTLEGTNVERITFYVVDLTDKSDLKIIGRFSVQTENEKQSLTGIIKTDSAIMVGRQQGYLSYDANGQPQGDLSLTYDVISLANPAKPEVVSTLEVPADIAYGGWGYNVSGCMIDIGWGFWGGYYGYGARQALVSGDFIVSQHQVPLNDGTERVRYYLDLIDVSDPSHPTLQDPVNIPGGVVDFDHETGRLITTDYLVEEKAAGSWDECKVGNYYGRYFDAEKVCRFYRRQVNTLELKGTLAELVDTELIDAGSTFATSVAVSKDRVFAYYYDYDSPSEAKLSTFAVRSSGLLERLDDVATEATTWATLHARGNRAFLSSYGQLTVVDSSDKADIEVTNFPMGGYYCNSLEVSGSFAYCALGYQGAQVFPLD